jgi:hypothetical protein
MKNSQYLKTFRSNNTLLLAIQRIDVLFWGSFFGLQQKIADEETTSFPHFPFRLFRMGYEPYGQSRSDFKAGS